MVPRDAKANLPSPSFNPDDLVTARPRRPHFIMRLIPVLLAVGALSGCHAVAPRLAVDGTSARVVADDLFGTISKRYDDVFREPRVQTARRLITHSLLVPSRVFHDTVAFTSSPDTATRLFAFRGEREQTRYRFSVDSSHAPPARPGDGRHTIQLHRVTEDVYEWVGTSEFAIGAVSPAAFANVPVAWLASAERADTAGFHGDVHAAFPRSTAAWGRLFSLESITTARDASGAWTEHVVATLHPDRATHTYPMLAAWLRHYVSPLRVHMRLHDARHTWFDAVVRGDSLFVQTRSRDGRVLPLEGGDALLPDTATLETDFSAVLLGFRVGFRALNAEFVSVRKPEQRGWALRFAHEPDWQLPPLAERMLHAPLHRPFTGTGIQFEAIAVSNGHGTQTVLARRLSAHVEESTIYRFLSRLISRGISDYVGGADKDLNAWMTSAFGALRDDAHAIVGGP